MLIYEKNNFAFLHINKTGGLTIAHILKQIAGDGMSINRTHTTIRGEFNRSHINYPGVNLHKLSIYVNIRNPFDRIVAIYAYRIKLQKYESRGITFDDYFYNIYMKGTIVNGPIEELILVKNKVPRNVNIVKLENIDIEWPLIIRKHFGITIGTIPKINSSDHNKPMSYFNDYKIKLVLEREKWVIDNYYPELKTGGQIG